MSSAPLSESLAELDTLLADAEAPVYAIDAQRRIVFANRATADWLGLSAEAVVGRQVEYHSEPAGASRGALLTGLCPSPEALHGRHAVGTISSLDRSGALRRRRARFVPLPADEGDACPVLVVAERRDLTAEELTELVTAGDPLESLHLAIRRFRASQAGGAAPLTLLGTSDAVRKLRGQVAAVVTAGCSALVTGATGSGRGELARAIHQQSSTRAPHQAEPAALLPVDGELAGFEEVEEALDKLRGPSPPVLLLAHADALPTDVQHALARGLAKLPRPRVLATADEPPERLSTELDAQIAPLRLRLPPLDERREDIPLLAQWFVEKCNVDAARQLAGVSEQAIERLTQYPFRDLHQLQEMIAEAHGECRGSVIDQDDLPRVVHQAALASELHRPAEQVSLDGLLADVERETVRRALRQARDNRAEAARLLGLTRQRFYRLLERLGLLDAQAPAEEPGVTNGADHDA